MGIIIKDGLNFFDGLGSGWIAVESERLDEYIEYINNNKVIGVALNDLYYMLDNVDFLAKCPYVERLSITSSYVLNYSGLQYLNKLIDLSLEEPKGKVNLMDLNYLEELSTEIDKKIIGIDKLHNLKVLRLWKYQPKSKDLSELSNLRNLEEIVLTQSPITSLKGCENFPKLKKLELNYLSKLQYIDGLENNISTLRVLKFNSCKKIKNNDYVANFIKLEELSLDECSEIPSIGFLRKLPKLKNFTFINTNIADGDLSPCLGLEYVGFFDKKHYSHRSIDFNK